MCTVDGAYNMIDLQFRVLRRKSFTSWISTFKKNLLSKFFAHAISFEL